MNTNDKLRVLEKVCGLVVGKPVRGVGYRLWVGDFDPDTFCLPVTVIGTEEYFVVDGKNEDDAITIAYNRLYSAVKQQVKFVDERR